MVGQRECRRCQHHEEKLQEQQIEIDRQQDEITRLSECYDKRQQVSCESNHPYLPQSSMVWELKIPGAARVAVRFHPSTCLSDGDKLVIYKSRSRDDVWASFDVSSNWPGIGDKDSLEVTSDVLYIGFYSARKQGQSPWGFKLYASATHFQGEWLPTTPVPKKQNLNPETAR
jgi:hypothetical protein